jgi:hypothetical protein
VPTEIRHVLFTHAEALEALLEHCRRSRRPLPNGQVTGTKFGETAPDGPLRFEVKVANDANPSVPRIYALEGLELLGALISYCKGRGIPLPMKADKKLQAFGQKVGLVLTLGTNGG